MSKTKHTFIDLFSGCGGLSLGFEKAGFKPVLAIDNWQDALNTYSKNNPDTPVLCADLLKLAPEFIKKHFNITSPDLIIGGPPCQGFSIAGKRIIDDDRNRLYKSFVSMVAYFKPKAFVLENVPNIVSIGAGAIKKSIIEDFQKLGYTVETKILIASDYGVPQNRRRAFFVGFINGNIFDFPSANIDSPITSWEAISDLPEGSLKDGEHYTIKEQSDYQKLMRVDSCGVFNHEISIHNIRTQKIISLVPDGGNYKDLPTEYQGIRNMHIAWTRLNSKKPSFTIDTGHRHHFHYKYNRIPTARESARIQSFPDNFIFTCSKTSQLKQIGNAVPPLMARAIAEQIIKYL